MRKGTARLLSLPVALTIAAAGLAASGGAGVSGPTGLPPPAAETITTSGGSPSDAAELYQVRPGLRIERFATGLALPVNLALAPGAGSDPGAPFLYVTELHRGVAVIAGDGTVSTYAEGLLNFDPVPRIPGGGGSGVIGLVVDPQSGDLLVSLAYREDEMQKSRVLRLKSSPDGMTAVGEQVVIEDIPSDGNHQVHTLTIGPDGKLYVNVADGNEEEAAQDDADLRGKILRLNLDGSVPDDNPTAGSAVFAKGFRNPFGAAWHPDQPWLYASDNGVLEGDRILKVEAGGNYGWPDIDDLLETALYVFDRDDVISPTAIAFDSDHLLTPEGETHLFVAVTGPIYHEGSVENGKKILDFRLNAAGEVEAVKELLHYVGDGRSSVIGIAFGPDALYFSDLYGETGFDEGPVAANIYRVFPGPVLQGDGNCDGSTDALDGLFILQFAAGLRAGSGQCPLPPPAPPTMRLSTCDVSDDGACGTLDALFVLQCAAGLRDCIAFEPLAAQHADRREPSGAALRPNGPL